VRLLVVVAVIAAVIGLGVVWRSSPAASLVSNDRRFGDGGERGGERHGDRPEGFRGDRRGDGGAGLSSIDDLGQTVFVVAAIVGGVVVIDLARRRRRPVRPQP
jgi:hypothetical protein